MTSSLALSNNHVFYTSENDMKTICQNHLSQYGIRYFEYLRVHDDGQSIMLANNQDVVRYVFDNQVQVAAPIQQDYVRDDFHYFILPVGDYAKPIHEIKSYFNLSNFVNLVERHPGYIDLYCFGTDAYNSSIINFYLNKMDVLENFKSNFKEHSKQLVKTALQNKIELPENMLPSYKGLSEKSEVINLTKRQKECLFYLLQGMSLKQIARALSLSPRTIEHYLDAVKIKLDCNSRVELFEKARKLKLIVKT